MTETNHQSSLSEVHGSVKVDSKMGFWKKLFAFLGPAYLVSVGYMDPGNWATDIAGGSQFGYALIWVLLMSNLMALLLQSLSARLGIVRGRDLAQASREMFPGFVNYYLYGLAEIAIAACDLAEILGMAIGLNLLFEIPLIWGVLISALDTFLLLFLLNHGIRKMEVFIISLVATIGGAFVVQMFIAQPSLPQVAGGFVPTALNDAALYIAIGIIGATVMPHNLYLHSALVQTRKFERTAIETRRAIRFNFIDSTIALNAAFFVNAAILVLAGSAFYSAGLHEVSDITEAHHLLEPLLGSQLAPVLFAVALLCAGQSSTITGTLAGQIIMEGYLNLRIAPWIRRLITRLIAIVPAVLVIHYYGEEATGDLLILSQVILSLQLGFAVIPLIHFVSDRERMGEFVIPAWTRVAAWVCAGIIVSLNIKLVVSQIEEWLMTDGGITTRYLVIPFAIFSLGMLLYITLIPIVRKLHHRAERIPHREFKGFVPQPGIAPVRIAVCLDFGNGDQNALQKAIDQGGKQATYFLIHITESAGARWLGTDIRDMETGKDLDRLHAYSQALSDKGFSANICHGFGTPSRKIPEIVKETNCDLVVMSAHGHRAFMDFLLGSTVDSVRHRVRVPVMIVQGA